MVHETNNDSLILEGTSDGYIENINLKGKTLVNILGDGFKNVNNYLRLSGVYIDGVDKSFVRFTMGESDKPAYRKLESTPLLTPSTDYTVVVEVLENTIAGSGDYHILYPVSNTEESVFTNLWGLSATEATKGLHIKLITTKNSFNGCTLGMRSYVRYIEGASGYITYRLMLLKGDYTQNPPSYFEGLKSVGEDVEELKVLSLKSGGNLLHCEDFSVTGNGVTLTYDSFSQEFTLDGTCTADNTTLFYPSTINKCALVGAYSGRLILSNPDMSNLNVRFYNSNFSKGVILNNKKLTHTGTFVEGDIVTFSIRVDSGQAFNNDKFKVCFNKGNTSIPYETYKEHKKELLYKGVDGVWKKPELCGLNTIEKHSDGKWYYHKRSTREVLNNTKTWHLLNSTPNLRYWTTPKKLGKPETQKLINDFTNINNTTYSRGNNHIGIDNNGNIVLGMDKSKIDITYLLNNPITLVYELAQEEVYECLPIAVASYNIETTYRIESGVIAPTSTFELDYTLSNAVARVLDAKVYNNAMKDNLRVNITKIREVL